MGAHSTFVKWIVLAAVLFTCRTATADPGPPPEPVPEIVDVLNMVWRLDANASDHMGGSTMDDFNSFPSDGQYYYVPFEQKASNPDYYTPLYRLFDGSDHMTSTLTSEGGHSYDATLGYPYTNQLRGTVEITRWFNSSTGDHALQRPGETMPGYGSQNLPTAVYAYPRNGNSDPMLTLSGGGVTIKSSLNAGGSIFSWKHNGREYVSIFDLGHQIQSACVTSHTEGSYTWDLINPTEAGGMTSWWGYYADPPSLRPGSPLLTGYNDGLTQVTRAIPFDYGPTRYYGGDWHCHPVIYRTAILGKNITLNYNGLGAVAKYETVLVPPATTNWLGIEIPTGYLLADLDTYWGYDAGEADPCERLELVIWDDPPPDPFVDDALNWDPNSGFGGIIISITEEPYNYAMGIYGALVPEGGSVSTFYFGYLIAVEDDNDPNSYSASKYAASAVGVFEDKYEYTFTTWIISGTLAEVCSKMDLLYASGELGTVQVTPVNPQDIPGPYQIPDIAVYQTGSGVGVWQGAHDTPPPGWLGSEVTTQTGAFGTATAIPLLGDVNGDGVDDIVVVQENGTGFLGWVAGHSTIDSNGVGQMNTVVTSSLSTFGLPGANNGGAFLADINGDGTDDAIVVDVNLGGWYGWYAQPSGDGNGLGAGGAQQGPVHWGYDGYGDVPLVGDFDGDGLADLVIWRRSTGEWSVRKSTSYGFGTGNYVSGIWGYPYGDRNYTPLVGDFNGDGRDDAMIVWDDGTGVYTWQVSYANANGVVGLASGFSGLATFGRPATDTPILADINGDGRADIGYIRKNSDGTLHWFFTFTNPGGVPNYLAAVHATFGADTDIPLIGQFNIIPVPGDINNDGCVNLIDFAFFAIRWMDIDCESCGGANLTDDGDVNFDDLKVLADNWLRVR